MNKVFSVGQIGALNIENMEHLSLVFFDLKSVHDTIDLLVVWQVQSVVCLEIT